MQAIRLALALACTIGAFAVVHSAASARPSPAPSPGATPTVGPISHEPEDPAVTKVARAQFLAWQLGKLDRSRYTDVLSQLITDDRIANSSQGLSKLGPLQRIEWVGLTGVEGLAPNNKTYLYHMVCGTGAVFMQFSLTPAGKISSMLFRDQLDEPYTR